jgi:hypothetical protein
MSVCKGTLISFEWIMDSNLTLVLCSKVTIKLFSV